VDAVADSARARTSASRLVALDTMRGLVMVLMAIDHSSATFNAGRLFTDGAWLYKPGTPLPALQFLTRWITHLCAPSFVFLAGTSLALYVQSRSAAGETARAIDRHIALRGVVIAAFELWVSLFWMQPGHVLLQVLYGIGSSFLLMVPLRRVPTPALVALAVAVLVLGEWFTGAMGWGPPERTPLWAALLMVPGRRGRLIIGYPTLPWLSIMLLGWAFGRHLAGRPDPRPTSSRLAAAGVASLGAFALVRGANGYGNMGLLRDDRSLVQWLHVSKYPPSVAFAALELGTMALALAGLWLAATIVEGPARRAAEPSARDRGLLVVLGRTPMFFYLLHIPVLALLARGLGVEEKLGLGATYGFAALVVAVLYPACLAYGRYKARRVAAWTQYI
jgi:uncharacterized membrane protein